MQDHTKILSKQQMENMVYKRRQKEFGNWEQLISISTLIYADDNTGSYFLLFQSTISMDAMIITSTHKKFIGWDHPKLIRKLRSGPLYIHIYTYCI